MKILLTGGGSGGHITPLLAVARELKRIDSEIQLIGVCESGAKFAHLFEGEPAIDSVRQIAAGKYRRYTGLTRLQRLLDIPTFARNVRDVGRVCKGYTQARTMLKQEQPDGIIIKGGFVGVPVGLAAAHLKIPFITHDSDSTPGLANRIIARWAKKHATGMPTEFYSYPKGSMVYTGIPISHEFMLVNNKAQQEFKQSVGLNGCDLIIAVIGGSQGGSQLNDDMAAIIARLMQLHTRLGLIHIAGPLHEQAMHHRYTNELLADERRRVVVKGFVSDVYRYIGAADIVVSRASATVIAELAVQGKATVVVPGQLADNHQVHNAQQLSHIGAVLQVNYGDQEGLFEALHVLLTSTDQRMHLAKSLHKMAKPEAAMELAALALSVFK